MEEVTMAKRPPGRPRKPDNELRLVRFSAWVTVAEAEVLHSWERRTGRSVTGILRQVCQTVVQKVSSKTVSTAGKSTQS